MIPIIDLFAGPGGLGEGFSSLLDENRERIFKIKLSIEKDSYAHQTLKLRSFFRQFPVDGVPEDYYLFVRGEISMEELYESHPEEAARADEEAWCATLGKPDKEDRNGVDNEEIDKRIRRVLGDTRNWVLIGGPPCQAFSLVGRSRRKQRQLNEETDKRVGLYKEYLRIIAEHSPAVFVMENVKGLLSAQTEECENIFSRILRDLQNPVEACIAEGMYKEADPVYTRYRIYSLTTLPGRWDGNGNPVFKPEDFLIHAEKYGVPQKRHRVILLGIREDLIPTDRILEKQEEVSLESVIGELPALRSGITRLFEKSTVEKDEKGTEKKKRYYAKEADSAEKWGEYVRRYSQEIDGILEEKNRWECRDLPQAIGEEFRASRSFFIEPGHPLFNWYTDTHLGGVLHHVSRKHLVQDLKRYLFAARYTREKGVFPRLEDYKHAAIDLLPDHENAESGKFADRFRVQLPDIPATTVTSHISKDGHYFIHYDPAQCRSFTVREAARVQTFPDNYYFCGGRTQKFHQVGNAVPPYLAYQIADIVLDIFRRNDLLD